MCYDISFKVNIPELKDYYPSLVMEDQVDLQFGPVDHVQGVELFPKWPIIYINRQDWQPHCRLMEWGIIKHDHDWEPPNTERNKMLNARSEKVFTKNTYWHVIRNRRCLIPVTSIFEHRHIQGWRQTVPYNIRITDQPIFTLPGLYSVSWIPNREGELVRRWTFAMLTRKGNTIMSQIHNAKKDDPRMPLFQPKETSLEYLQESLTEARYKEILNYSIPSEALSYYPVFSIRGRKPRPDGKDKTEYWEWPKLPALGTANPD